MRINTNISAMNTYSRLTAANNSKSGSLAKLSSGLRINRAGDDAAGLAISEKMRGQIGGLKQATRNAQDAISLIQTAEGGLNETHSILNRMRDLAVQSANDTNTTSDRGEIQKEMDELAKEITRISENTEFNTQKLLGANDNGKNFAATFHIGANDNQNIKLEIEDMSSSSLSVGGKATAAVAKKDAVDMVASSADIMTDLKVTGPDHKVYKISTAALVDNSGVTTASLGGTNNDELTIALGASGSSSGDITATLADVKAAIESKGFTVEYKNDEATDSVKTAVEVSSAVSTSGGIEATAATREMKVGEEYGVNVYTQEAADAAIKTISDAIDLVSAERSKLGATQNRLDHTINNLTATAENLSEAESRIRDVDMAEEMMEFTKSNILSQAATSMLAQANQMPQGVLQLLQ